MFTPLLGDFEALRSRTARFRRIALHLHSPDSHDWGRTGEAERNGRERFAGEEGLSAFADELSPHLDLVAVTDHMRCSFAAQLSAIGGTLTVLPGMEVNLKIEPIGFARIHVLTILPERSSKEAFARLFAGQSHIPRDDKDRTGQEEVTGKTLSEWVAQVHAEHGLCIAAHVESTNGVRKAFRQAARDVLKLFTVNPGNEAEQDHDVPDTLKDYLFDAKLDAIEIHRSADGQHYRWISSTDARPRSIATLLTFDAHCCEAFNRPDRVSHVKMTSVGIVGLRQALRLPDTRIRFSHNLPQSPHPRLLGISIKGSEESFFDDMTIALAENLNCIIGVRGSGKSTIIEALRYIFGYNRTLSELDKPMANAIREMQVANLKGSIIRVAYRMRTGEDRILQATFDEKSDYVTKCFSVDGEQLEISDVETCGHFPLRLFGWSEIETLGRSPTRQRDLLDRLIPELAPAMRHREEIRQRLKVNRGEIAKCLAELDAALSRNGGHIQKYAEYVADFEKQNTPIVRELFAALDLSKAKRRILEQVGLNVAASLRQFEALSTMSLRTELEVLLSQSTEELRDWWLGTEFPALAIAEVETGLSAFARQAVERLTIFSELLAMRLEINSTEIQGIERNLQATLDESGDDSMQRIFDLRANAERRLNNVAETRRQYLSHWGQLQTALTDRTVICSDLAGVQDQIAGIRARHNEAVEQTLNRFLPAWMKVSILFRAGQDKADFEAKLPLIVPGRSNSQKVAKVRNALLAKCNPVTSAAIILDNGFDKVLEMFEPSGENEFKLAKDDIGFWQASIWPYEHNSHSDVEVLADGGSRLNAILDLQETAWDDYATILLDGDPVNEKSPGQRASAMLPLVALAEKTPIVIDQPEDNLDKRLIGSVLMQVLAELKENRQITVCTHDPNIVVGGDAEQVIVLKAESNRRGVVEAHGSIDNDSIVKTVIELLEGGREAFEARSRRYGLDDRKV